MHHQSIFSRASCQAAAFSRKRRRYGLVFHLYENFLKGSQRLNHAWRYWYLFKIHTVENNWISSYPTTVFHTSRYLRETFERIDDLSHIWITWNDDFPYLFQPLISCRDDNAGSRLSPAASDGIRTPAPSIFEHHQRSIDDALALRRQGSHFSSRCRKGKRRRRYALVAKRNCSQHGCRRAYVRGRIDGIRHQGKQGESHGRIDIWRFVDVVCRDNIKILWEQY